jgi:hypothetical protein
MRLNPNKPIIPIPILLLLMYKMLLLRLPLLVKPLRSIQFSLCLPINIKIKRKGRVRKKRIKLIINNPKNPRLILLRIKKKKILVILVLSVVRTIIRKIVQDVQRLLSSCKEPRHLLHLSFCHNIFLLKNNPNWLFMTNPLPLPPLMYLCVPVTPRKMKLQSLLKPKIILLLKRKSMIHLLHWLNLFHPLHLPMVLFISNDLV